MKRFYTSFYRSFTKFTLPLTSLTLGATLINENISNPQNSQKNSQQIYSTSDSIKSILDPLLEDTNTEESKVYRRKQNNPHLKAVSLEKTDAPSVKNTNNKLVWMIHYFGKNESEYDSLSYSTQCLIRALQARGFEVKVLSSQDLDIELKNFDVKVNTSEYLQNTKISHSKEKRKHKNVFDEYNVHEEEKLPCFVLSRMGSNTKFRELSLYHLLESYGIPVINSPLSIEYCKNKLLSYTILSSHNVGIPVPHTILIDNDTDGKGKVDQVLNKHNMKLPLVLKLLNSSGGDGVFIAYTKRELEQLFRIAGYFSQDIVMIAQECVEESIGKDVRIWVVGDKVVGNVMRYNDNKDDFRSNVKVGGKPFKLEIDETTKQLAIDASLALGLDYSGVDLLFNGIDKNTGKQLWKIAEVNSSPGWDLDAEIKNNINIAQEIIDHICEKYGLIDLNQFQNIDNTKLFQFQ